MRLALAALIASLALPAGALAADFRVAPVPSDGFRGAEDAFVQWGVDKIRAPEVWPSTDGAGAVVAVADSGSSLGHEDLAGQFAPGGKDYVDNDNNPTDLHSHGTHITGIVAAIRDNSLGIRGVAPGAKVLALRVLDATLGGTAANVAAALNYAPTQGARIVNASFVSATNHADVQQAIIDNPNVLYVFASGNDSLNVDSSPRFPCAYPQANILCVTATDVNDARLVQGNVGAVGVDLGAPGVDIYSACTPLSTYCFKSGTSMAAPHVAAVAALLWAKFPSASVATIRQAILDGAKPVGALSGVTVTGARLDAAGAFALLNDGDGDGLVDARDNCVSVANPDQADGNADGVGDACTPAPPPPAVTPALPVVANPPPVVATVARLVISRIKLNVRKRTATFRATKAGRVRLKVTRRNCRGRLCTATWTVRVKAGTNTIKLSKAARSVVKRRGARLSVTVLG